MAHTNMLVSLVVFVLPVAVIVRGSLHMLGGAVMQLRLHQPITSLSARLMQARASTGSSATW
jgi:hypothetical protein